jgi:hypothetical protein
MNLLPALQILGANHSVVMQQSLEIGHSMSTTQSSEKRAAKKL